MNMLYPVLHLVDAGRWCGKVFSVSCLRHESIVANPKFIKIIVGLSKIDISDSKDLPKIPSSKILVYSEKPSTCFGR